MFFYLHYSFSRGAALSEQALPEAGEAAQSQPNTLYLHSGRQRRVSMDTPGGKLILLGDPVFEAGASPGSRIVSASGHVDEAVLYDEIRGHYYWFLLRPGSIDCGTSFGAIFPVYTHSGSDGVWLSSSSFFLAGQVDAGRPDRRNLLERLLFNYPFFNSTWRTGIRRLAAHRHLHVDTQGMEQRGDFEISHFFGTGQKNTQADLHAINDLFAQECRLFLPDTAPFGISFTGGFDGRTLLAAARNAGRTDFLSYSFGRPGASDVTFPEAQARALGIPYEPILLDQDYLDRHALASARGFMQLTEYNGNFGRPHYHFAAQRLAEKVDYLVTGNFGSEMFRALHQPGVMMTEALIRVFSATDDSWKAVLRRQSPPSFEAELEALIADLEAYLAPMADWPPNHKFYHFVFNEIFRSYFGPELVMQSHFLNNRTPFLSLRFFRALNDTIWSGVHSNLFEKQKNKRLKGQVFYASFLRRSDPELYRQPTNKGYSPADVLEPWRLPLLLGRVAWHKLMRQDEQDSNAVDAFFLGNRETLQQGMLHDAAAALAETGLDAWLDPSRQEADLETRIKYYSLAAGWTSASTPAPSLSESFSLKPH